MLYGKHFYNLNFKNKIRAVHNPTNKKNVDGLQFSTLNSWKE